MRGRELRSRLAAAGRHLLVAATATTLLLGVTATRLAVQGPSRAHAAARTISTTQLQWDLAGLGYLPWSGVDGVAGPQTTAALKTFQSNVCITVDGVDGPQTDNSLSAVVKAVQAKAGATQDGLFGSQTKADVESYQKAHKLSVDGQAGPDTMAAMGITRVHVCGSAPATPAPRTPTPAPHTPTPAPHTATPAPHTPTPAPHTPTPAPHAATPAPGSGGQTGSPRPTATATMTAAAAPATPAPTQTCVPMLQPALAMAPALQPCLPASSARANRADDTRASGVLAGAPGASSADDATDTSDPAAWSTDELAWPAVLGGVALVLGLALLLLARRTPGRPRRPRH